MSNWLTHNLKSRTLSNKLPFSVNFNFTNFSPKSFVDEAEKVCLELYTKYGNNLYLAFSGGADSEFILRLLLKLKIPVTPVIVSCPYNQTDILPALTFCKENSLDSIILNYGNEYLDIAKTYIYDRGLISPIGLAPILVYEHIKHIGGKVISGQGEPLPITVRNGNTDTKTIVKNVLQMYEFEFYMDVYAEDEQPAPFYCYNQNIFYSYMKEIDTNIDIESAKCKLYSIPYRNKTYWDENIYENIRNNAPVPPSGIKCNFEFNKVLDEMELYVCK